MPFSSSSLHSRRSIFRPSPQKPDKDADKKAGSPVTSKKETKKGTTEEKKDESKKDGAKKEEEKKPGMNADTFSGLKFRSIGPGAESGRVMSIAVNPKKKHEFYVGVASGGVWKTVNDGTTWTPLFDGEGSYSIGWVELDPNDSSVVWVGAGEIEFAAQRVAMAMEFTAPMMAERAGRIWG